MPKVKPCTSHRPEVVEIFRVMPSMNFMFAIFWSHDVLRKIVRETNRNARELNNGIHGTRVHPTKGGPGWYSRACIL